MSTFFCHADCDRIAMDFQIGYVEFTSLHQSSVYVFNNMVESILQVEFSTIILILPFFSQIQPMPHASILFLAQQISLMLLTAFEYR